MNYSSSKKCAFYKQKNYSPISPLYNSFSAHISPFSLKYKYLKESNQNFCCKHNKIMNIFCVTCVNDICSNCLNNHASHKIFKYSEITKKEINILKNTIKSNMTKLNQLLIEIKNWKNALEEKINFLKKIIYSGNNIDFIDDYENNKNKIQNLLIIFKKIYTLTNSQEYIEDKNITKLEYLSSKQGDFIKNGIEIIKYLSKISILPNNNEYNYDFDDENSNNRIQNLKINFRKLKENKNNKVNKKNYNTNEKYRTNSYNTYNSSLRLSNNKDNNDNDYFKDINCENFDNINKTSRNRDVKSDNKDEVDNSFNSNNSLDAFNFSFFNTEKKKNNKNRLYTKKLFNNIFQINKSNTKLNRSVNIKLKKYLDFSDETYNSNNSNNSKNSNSNIISNNIPFKNLDINNIDTPKIKNFAITMNSNDYFLKYKNKKSNEIKFFTHKKLFPKNKNIEYNNNKEDKSYSQKINDKKLNNSIILSKKFLSSPIKSNLFINNLKKDIPINKNSLKINDLDDKDFPITIVKTKSEKQFKINSNEPLFIGFNLDNSNCQLSIIDQNNNDIQIISFKKDEYDIPTMIYFDENNEDIKIGHDAKLMENIYPKQIINNLIKLFGMNSDDILNKKKLWPFQIYKESNERIFIKINYCGKKEKKFYIENLLILFFEQLFKKLFSKFIIEEDEIKDKNKYGLNILNINICITIPTYFSYIKRKILEKIFQKHIFQNMIINYNYNYDINIVYNNNNSMTSSKQSTASTINYSNHKNKNNKILEINLNSIKIEYSPNLAILCLQNINNDINESLCSSFSFQTCSKENNILILNISGDSTIISINSINNEKINNNSKDKYLKKYQVKSIINLNYGEEDFINNYFFSSLQKIDINIYNNIINSPNELLRVKTIFYKNIKLLDKNPLIEIRIDKFIDNYNLEIILKYQDYINCCIDLFNNIISSIRNILYQSKLSEMSIDYLLLIGNLSKCEYMRKILCELFKNNKQIYNKLHEYNFENDEFYLVTGASLESMNNNLNYNYKKYIFKDICPISFGIENSSGDVDLIIKKGNKIPIIQKNLVKIYKNKNSDLVQIKICEIDNENKKIILSNTHIDIKNMKLIPKNKLDNEFIELLFEFEIDENFNLSVFILDLTTFKRRFEFSINIDVVVKDK